MEMTARETLNDLARLHGTDKSDVRHDFCRIYERYLEPLRDRPINMLEIGVLGGASLRMWRDYFPNGRIWGLDNKEDATQHADDRIGVFVGDQQSPRVLGPLVEETGTLDLIVDDGGHRPEHQLGSLRFLWPHLNSGGIYIVEDIHTSYLPRWGGGWRRFGTTVEFLKAAVDDISARLHKQPAALAHLSAVHFYYETCLLEKG